MRSISAHKKIDQLCPWEVAGTLPDMWRRLGARRRGPFEVSYPHALKTHVNKI